MAESNGKRMAFVQYFNTVILTIIAIFIGIAVTTLDKVRDSQAEFATRLVRMETIQPLNTSAIKSLDEEKVDKELFQGVLKRLDDIVANQTVMQKKLDKMDL